MFISTLCEAVKGQQYEYNLKSWTQKILLVLKCLQNFEGMSTGCATKDRRSVFSDPCATLVQEYLLCRYSLIQF